MRTADNRFQVTFVDPEDPKAPDARLILLYPEKDLPRLRKLAARRGYTKIIATPAFRT